MGVLMKNDEVTQEGIEALARKLEAMKATGTYAEWRSNLRKEVDAYEASPRGLLGRLSRWLQGAWWWISGTRPW